MDNPSEIPAESQEAVIEEKKPELSEQKKLFL
jgi:hypothetical protein